MAEPKVRRPIAVVAAALVLSMGQTVVAQDEDTHATLRTDIDALTAGTDELRQSIETMRSEQQVAMDDLKALLTSQAPDSDNSQLEILATLKVQVYWLTAGTALAVVILAVFVFAHRKSACLAQIDDRVAKETVDLQEEIRCLNEGIRSLDAAVSRIVQSTTTDELQATTEGNETMKMFNDLEPQDSLGPSGQDVSYASRERTDGKFIIRIWSTNHRILLESDNTYDTREEAEDMLAQIHDHTVEGKVRRVHKDDTQAQ